MGLKINKTSWRAWLPWAGYAQILLAVLLVVPAARIRIEDSTEAFTDQTQDLAKLNKEVFKTFDTEDILLLAYTGKDLFSQESLDLQMEVLEKLEKLPLVRAVSAIPQVYRDLFDGENPEALKEEMLSTPFYKGLFVSQDASVGAFLMELRPKSDLSQPRQLVQGAEETAKILQRAGFQTHLVGSNALDVLLEDITQSEMLRTFPPAFLCSVVMLILLFRSLRATAVTLLCMGVTVVLTLGCMSLLGQPLNMATSSLPILLWVLGLSNLIHIIRHYQHHLAETGSVPQAIDLALKATAMPCAVAILTTAMGFLSLITTGMGPIRQLAIWISIGLCLSLCVSLTVGPLLLKGCRVPGHRKKKGAPLQWTHVLSHWAPRMGPATMVLSLLLLAVTLYLTPKVRVEANNLDYLPKDSEFVQSCEFVRTRLTGIFPLDVVIEVPGGWLDPEIWPILDRLAGQVQSLPGVAKVVSPLDTLKKMNQWDHAADPAFYALPSSREAAQRLWDLLDDEEKLRMRSLLAQDGRLVRMSVLLSATESTSILAVRDGVEAYLRGLREPVKGKVVGDILRSMTEQLDLVNGQVQSFGTAIATIYLCILIGLRSWRLTLISLFPNVMPALFVFAIMAVLHIPLNPATIMVASVALGISVEDVIHLLASYKQHRQKGEAPPLSIAHALDAVGPGVAMTTIVACIGFLALGRSLFVPIRSFGLLSSIAMMVALLNNLFLVPALLTFRERKPRLR